MTSARSLLKRQPLSLEHAVHHMLAVMLVAAGSGAMTGCDLEVYASADSTVSVRRPTPNPAYTGQFQLPVLIPLPHPASSYKRSLVEGDFNGDGATDLMLNLPSQPSQILFYPNTAGSIEQGHTIDLGRTNPKNPLYVADLDGNGCDDLIGAPASETMDSAILVLLGESGKRPLETQVLRPVRTPQALQLGVFKTGGRPDVVSVDSAGNLTILNNLGMVNGFLSAKPWLLPFGKSLNGVAVGDFDGDGRTDIVAWLSSKLNSPAQTTIFTFLGRADGTVMPPFTQEVPLRIDTLSAADMNKDGKHDLVALFQYGTRVVTLQSSGGAYTYGPESVLNGANDETPTLVDLDLDGVPDLLIPDQGAVAVFRGSADGAFHPIYRQRLSASRPAVGKIVVADLNQDGILDLGAAVASDELAFGILYGE